MFFTKTNSNNEVFVEYGKINTHNLCILKNKHYLFMELTVFDKKYNLSLINIWIHR
jgi:hypothetical protein